MPERQNVRTIETPQLQGDDSWIKIKAMSVAQYNCRAAINRSLNTMDATAEDYEDRVAALDRESNQLMAECVVDWNWVDDDGNPLPKPHNNPDAIRKLTMPELMFIGEQLNFNGDNAQKKPNLKPSKKR